MADILGQILATKRDEVAALRRARPGHVVDAAAQAAMAPRDLEGALRAKIAAGRAAVTEIEAARAAAYCGQIRSAGDHRELLSVAGRPYLSYLPTACIFKAHRNS
jgi:indole-3-glycerol phosphate synthase